MSVTVSNYLHNLRDRTLYQSAEIVLLAIFWGWLVLRWTNDFAGGLVRPAAEPFVSPSAFAAVPQLEFAVQYLPQLAQGIWVTILLTILAISLGFPIAIVLAVARSYGRVSNWLALSYIELIRGTPLLAQLFVLYYGLNLTPYLNNVLNVLPGPLQGVVPSAAFWVGVIGLTINSSAYQAEYLRGAIESVGAEQLEASRAVGMSKPEGIYYVVLPQAVRYAIPSWTNELVYLVKYSSIASFVTVSELFNEAMSIASQNYRFMGLFTITGVLYLLIILTAIRVMELVERKTSVPGLN